MIYDRWVDRPGYFYFMRNEVGDGAKVTLHMHNSIELKFFVKGNCSAMIEDRKINCKRGDVIFVDSRKPHMYISVGDSVNYVLIIDNDIFKQVFPKGKTLSVYMDMYDNIDVIEQSLGETFEKWKDMDYNQRKGFVYRMLGMMLQYNGLVDEKKEEEKLVAKIIEYIREHCHEEITLDILSKEFGYSRNYFSNFFNKRFYMNLRECVNRFRVERAMRLIEQSGKSLSLCAIAERCGYNSMNTFYRAMKRYSGDIYIKDS